MFSFEEIQSAVMAGDMAKVADLTRQAIEEKVEPAAIINEGYIPAMNVVGKRFKNGDMFVPEVLMAARSMNTGMELVKPLLVEGEVQAKGTVVLGTVKGDLHDIGKNLVGMMIESGGYDVIDLGIDLEPEKFVAAVKENKPQIVGMSALLTTTMLAMKETIELLKEEGLRDGLKVMIGGAPVSKEFSDEIGADGYAPDAASATELVEKLINA